MKKISLKSIEKKELLSREELKQIIGGTGSGDPTPGGNNGNPCPEFCEPYGGTIWCCSSDSSACVSVNCNTMPYNSDYHNKCKNASSGDFWC